MDKSLEDLDNTKQTPLQQDTGTVTPKSLEGNGVSTPIENATEVPVMSDTRLYIIGLGIWISLFLAAFETTVVATCLVDITSEFQDFNRASWIVVAYLLTYNGFLLLSSKLCDIVGIKTMFLVANGVFLVFSILCGAAKNMNQLIVFRAFQGIGGGGIYCIAFILMMSIITKEKLAAFSGGISSVFAIASISGPLLGGVITTNTTWRWAFYLNGPAVAVAFAILFFSIPNINQVRFDRENLRRIDIGGGFLSVAWSILVVFALQEGGAAYPWKHGIILGTLISGIFALFLFAGYEWFIARTSKIIEPIFPLRLLKDPAFTFLVLTTFCIGVPIYVAIINIPQRFQVVHGTSAIRAGVLLLPMLVTSPVVSIIPGILLKNYFRYGGIVFVTGAAFSVIGAAGLGTMGRKTGSDVDPKVYAFLIFLGIGMGLVMPIGVMFVKFLCDPKDEAVALGAQNMTRVLGGLVGLAVGTAVLHHEIEDKLPEVLTSEELAALLKSTQVMRQLTPEKIQGVREVYAASFDYQFNMAAAFAGLGLLFAIGTAWYSWQVLHEKDIFSPAGASPAKAEKTEDAKKEEA